MKLDAFQHRRRRLKVENSKDPDSEKPEIGIPDEFKGLLIDPPLLEGEDPEAYRSYLAP